MSVVLLIGRIGIADHASLGQPVSLWWDKPTLKRRLVLIRKGLHGNPGFPQADEDSAVWTNLDSGSAGLLGGANGTGDVGLGHAGRCSAHCCLSRCAICDMASPNHCLPLNAGW
jgi:hypothetical protein